VSIVRSRKRCRRKDSQRRGRNIAVDDISSYSAFNHDIPEHDRIAYRGKVTADWRQQLDATKSWHGGQQLGAITTPTTSTSPAHASHPTTSSLHTRTHILANMDSLVAQYSRPAFAEEGQTEEEQLELYGSTPGLSLKFALPPVAQVGFTLDFRTSYTDEISVSVMAPRNDG
jgi:hypothetical protein